MIMKMARCLLVDTTGVGAAGVGRSALHGLGYRTVSHSPRPVSTIIKISAQEDVMVVTVDWTTLCAPME